MKRLFLALCRATCPKPASTTFQVKKLDEGLKDATRGLYGLKVVIASCTSEVMLS